MMYYISILLSIFALIFMVFTRKRTKDPIGYSLDTPLAIQIIAPYVPFAYFIFMMMIIIFGPNLVIGLFTVIVLQLLVNPIIGGILIGTIEHFKERRKV